MTRLYKKGFTLVELLAVIVVLGIVLVIAIPSIVNVIENTRKNSFVATARQLVEVVKLKISDGTYSVPMTSDHAIIVNMSSVSLDNANKDVDNGSYGPNSYVIAANIGGDTKYYVTLDGSKRDINGVAMGDLVISSIVGTATTYVGQTFYYDNQGATPTYKISNYTTGAFNGSSTCGTGAQACTRLYIDNIY